MVPSLARDTTSGRRIAIFGGTFDPIHLGHLAVARAAIRRFHLQQVYFVPSERPPHKTPSELVPFTHRFAMVALACAEQSQLVPSLAESEANGVRRRIYYSVDTIRQFQREFKKPGDRIYFLLGADSFLDIRAWRDYRTLLGLCDFIVAHRPGFPSEALRRVIPAELLAAQSKSPAAGSRKQNVQQRQIALLHTSVYLLDTVDSDVSATAVRQRLDRGRSIHGLVPPSVEEYIKKQALYDR